MLKYLVTYNKREIQSFLLILLFLNFFFYFTNINNTKIDLMVCGIVLSPSNIYLGTHVSYNWNEGNMKLLRLLIYSGLFCQINVFYFANDNQTNLKAISH